MACAFVAADGAAPGIDELGSGEVVRSVGVCVDLDVPGAHTVGVNSFVAEAMTRIRQDDRDDSVLVEHTDAATAG